MKRLLRVIIGLCWLWAGVAYAQQPTLPSSSGAGPFLDPGNLAQPRPSPGGGGSSFPLTSNVSAANNKIQNQAAGAANGDTVVYGQSGALLNGLSLNGNALTGLAAATLAGQGIAYGQSGAQLNGLNLNSNQLTGLAAATANNQGIAYGQTGALLNGLSLNGNALTSLAALGLTPAATFPASPTTGQLAAVNTASTCAAGSAIALGGSTLCLGMWSGTQWLPAGGASGGSSSFPLAADVSANSHRITGFATNTTLGDALSQGQSHLNDMATATGNYAMGSNKLTGLAAGSANNDSLAFGQAGAKLNGLAGTGTTPTMSGFSTDNSFNVIAYGADPTAGTDSTSAVQAAVNAACAAQQSVAGAVTNTPTAWVPAGQYMLEKPIIVTCAGGAIYVRGAGQSASAFVQKTNAIGAVRGPMFFDTISTYVSSIAPTTATSLATGSGSALNFAGAYWLIDLGEVLHDFGANPYNTNTGFDMRAFAKLSAAQGNGAVITCSNGSATGQNASALKFTNLGTPTVQGGAACLYVDANLALRCAMNIGGTLKQATSANGAFTTATTHEPECSYDGANMRLFLDGTIVQTIAATGSISQRFDEDMTIGGTYTVFPASGGQTLWVGQLDSIEIANVARNTANYTMHTAKYAADSHTVALINGDITENFPGSSTPIAFGLDGLFGNTPGSGYINAWVTVQNNALSQGSGNQLSDFGAVGSVGVESNLATSCRYSNLSLTGNYAGLLRKRGSFNCFDTNLSLADSIYAAYIETDGSGVTHDKSIQINSCGAMCAAIVDSGGFWQHMYTAPQANTILSLLVDNASVSYNAYLFDDASFDVESGGNSTAVTLVGLGTYTFKGGGIVAHAASPPITVSSTNSNDQISVTLHDVPIAFTALNSGGPSTIFNFVGSYPANGTASATIYNSTYSNGNPFVPTLPTGMTFTNNSSFQIEKVGTDGWALPTQVLWPLPQYVVPGNSFFCKNCDPPMNPAQQCTSSGTQTGSWVHVVNGQYLCTP